MSTQDKQFIRARILIGVDEKGNWNAIGWKPTTGPRPDVKFQTLHDTLSDYFDGKTHIQYSWVVVEVPVPDVDRDLPTIPGSLTKTNLTPEDN